MTPLYGHDDEVARFVSSLIQGGNNDNHWGGPYVATGFLDAEQRLVGGVVYHNYSAEKGVIEFSGASVSPKWYGRNMLHVMFSYPFDQLECQMIFTRNSELNTRLHRQLKAYGFDLHRIERGRGRNEAEMLWTLTDEQWRNSRFYGVKDGQ